MSDLTPEAKKFLEEHLRDGAPTTAQRSRARAAALAVVSAPAVAAGAGAAAAGGGTAAAVGGSAGLGLGVKLAGLVISVAVGSAVAVPLVQWARTPSRGPVRVDAPAPAPKPLRVALAVDITDPELPTVKAPTIEPASEPEPVQAPKPVRRSPMRVAPPPAAVPALEPEPAPPIVAREQPDETPPVPDAQVRHRVGGATRSGPSAAPATSAIAQLRPDERLAAEVRMLGQVQQALRASDGAKALELLAAHDQSFGADARLTEEVRAARVLALCAVGRPDDAKAELERLRAESAGSVHLERLARACW